LRDCIQFRLATQVAGLKGGSWPVPDSSVSRSKMPVSSQTQPANIIILDCLHLAVSANGIVRVQSFSRDLVAVHLGDLRSTAPVIHNFPYGVSEGQVPKWTGRQLRNPSLAAMGRKRV
jgi:hypothetical protein